MAMSGNFSRTTSIRVPFSATSAGDPFDMVAAGIPMLNNKIRPDLAFAFVNETGWDVRLQGFGEGQAFAPVAQNKDSWSILARTDKGPFVSKRPMFVSVQAFSTPYNPIPAGTDFSGCVLELVYGRLG
jgi:hypothetical protein